MVGHTSCYFVSPPYRCRIGFKNDSCGHRICASMSNDVGRIRLHGGVLCSHVHGKTKFRTPLWEKSQHVCEPCWSIASLLTTRCQGRQQPLQLWLQCVAKTLTGIKSGCPNYTPCKKVNGGSILESLHLSVLLSNYKYAFVGQMSRPCSMNGTFVLFSAVVMGHFAGVSTITMDHSQSDSNKYSDSRLLFCYLILAKYLILIYHIIFAVLWFTVNSIAFCHSKTSRSTVVSTWSHVIQQLHKLYNNLDSPLLPPAPHSHMYAN